MDLCRVKAVQLPFDQASCYLSNLILRTRVNAFREQCDSPDDSTSQNLLLALLKDFSLHNSVLVIRDMSNIMHALFPPASAFPLTRWRRASQYKSDQVLIHLSLISLGFSKSSRFEGYRSESPGAGIVLRHRRGSGNDGSINFLIMAVKVTLPETLRKKGELLFQQPV